VGAILIVTGLVITHVWGWEATEVALQSQGPVVLPGRDAWVIYSSDGRASVSAGLQGHLLEYGPGATVRATSADGTQLALRRGHAAPDVTVLYLALTQDPELATRDALFAIPAVNLIVRVSPVTDAAGELTEQLQVQAYRSSTGELATEEVVRGHMSVPVGEVRLEIDAGPYAQITALYSPGRWPALIGVAILLAGIVSTVVLEASLASGPKQTSGCPVPDSSGMGAGAGPGA
jgi:hypothetical protein